KDLDQVVEIACAHPATATHIATKLVRRFVSDDPPPSLIQRVAAEFTRTGGEVKPLLKTIVLSNEFQEARGSKLKRPFRYVVSALRMMAADTNAGSGLAHHLQRMGMLPYDHPMPDGYADTPSPWLGSMLERWNFAFSLANDRIDSVVIPVNHIFQAIRGSEPARLFAHLTGRVPAGNEIRPLDAYRSRQAGEDNPAKNRDLLALVFSSPAFQRH
ncbi:MAG TPA: DUF1800 family protein, partial [Blastocatellia bacterium]|nr:DUF1800 family protein [Blastocatellia bacterium]